MHKLVASIESTIRKTSRIRISSDVNLQNAGRREALRVVAQGAVFPVGFFISDAAAASSLKNDASMEGVNSIPAKNGLIVRDFGDPWIELLRLLHEAAEVEHSLMIQYLYAAFSVKKSYQKIVGFGAPSSNELLGVAIQEMQHLGKVNQLLVALGATPNLTREDFPYEPQIYPFTFNLEPLSYGSLAKYVWTESPPEATDLDKVKNENDRVFCRDLERALGTDSRPNYIGSLYDSLITVLKELDSLNEKNIPDLQPWITVMHTIKTQGEVEHFRFFKRLFTGVHEGFGGVPDVWNRPVSDPLYPVNQVLVNPTAYRGHDRQIQDPQSLNLAWLGNLHYWIILTLLSEGYSQGSSDYIGLARGHMMGPFWALAKQLSISGAGMPFDPLSIGYSPGLTRQANSRLLSHLLDETNRLEKQLSAALPSDFPENCCRLTIAAISRLEPKVNSTYAPTQPWDDGLAWA